MHYAYVNKIEKEKESVENGIIKKEIRRRE